MQVHEQTCCDVGQARGLVKHKCQLSPLVFGTRNCLPTDQTLTVCDEVGWKCRLIKRRGASHDASPFAWNVRDSSRTIRE